jgi:hypothetical protein
MSSMPAAHSSPFTVIMPGNVWAQESIVMTDFLTALLVKFAAALLENLLIRLGQVLFAKPIIQGT